MLDDGELPVSLGALEFVGGGAPGLVASGVGLGFTEDELLVSLGLGLGAGVGLGPRDVAEAFAPAAPVAAFAASAGWPDHQSFFARWEGEAFR